MTANLYSSISGAVKVTELPASKIDWGAFSNSHGSFFYYISHLGWILKSDPNRRKYNLANLVQNCRFNIRRVCVSWYVLDLYRRKTDWYGPPLSNQSGQEGHTYRPLHVNHITCQLCGQSLILDQTLCKGKIILVTNGLALNRLGFPVSSIRRFAFKTSFPLRAPSTPK